MPLEAKLREDLKEKSKRLSALQEHRLQVEAILRNLTREMQGLEAVVKYLQGVLNDKPAVNKEG